MGQRPKVLTPLADPWSMLGNEIRVRRTDQGFSLARLSDQVRWDASYLAKFERGERTPTREQVVDIDHALQGADALVRLWESAKAWEEQGDTVRADVANHDLHVANDVAAMAPSNHVRPQWEEDEPVAVPARTEDGSEVMVHISRRWLMKGLGAAAVSATTAGANDAARASAVSEDLPADADPAEWFHAAKVRLMDRDNLRGPAAAISEAQQRLAQMESLGKHFRGQDKRRLREVEVQFNDLAGWLYQDQGHLDGASYWLSRSIENSHTVDPQVTAFMLARKSQFQHEVGEPDDALESALAAVNMARPGSRISVVGHTFAGQAHALLGEGEQSRTHFETAHAGLDTMHEDGPSRHYALFMCPAYVLSYEARALSALHEYRSSAERFEAALNQLGPSMHRDRGVYTAWLAQALTLAGQHDDAEQRGMEALAIASGTGSARILTELHHLADQLPRDNTATFHTALSDLDERN